MPGLVPSLSDLLSDLVLSGQTWCYCDMGARAGYSLPPAEAAWFHVVLHGTVRATSARSGTLVLAAGDIAVGLSGEAHALRLSADAPVQVLDFLREERRVDAPATFALGAPGAVGARVLSGRLAASLPAGASRQSLPGLVRLSLREAGLSQIVQESAFARAGIGPGSAMVLTRLAGLVLGAYLRADPQVRSLFSAARADPVEQALDLISGNPSANWTVERLARSVGLGRSSFAARFTERMGRSPMEAVAQARMDQAAALLRQGRLKVAEISELCGYGSEAAFTRRFTRHFGLPPSRMREAAREAAPQGPATASWLPVIEGRSASLAVARTRRGPAAGGTALGGKFLTGLASRS